MTSATAQKPPANMATASRQSRFSNFTMANGAEKVSHPIGSSSLQSIWGSGIGSYNKRETTGSRATGSEDESFPDGPSGSSALHPSSEADTWVSPRATWGSGPENGAHRKGSGSTSPNRTRDLQNFSDLSSAPTYFTTARQPIGQGSVFAANRSKPSPGAGVGAGAGLDPSTSAFNYSPNGGELAPERESAGSFASMGKFEVEQPLRSTGFLNVGGPSRDTNSTPSGFSEAESLQHIYGDNSAVFGHYGGQTPSGGHAHRPSIHGSASFPSQLGNNSRTYSIPRAEEEEFHESVRRSLTLNDATTDGAASAYQTQTQTHNQTAQPFQFNPGSVPWDSALARSFGGPVGGSPFMQDTQLETHASGYSSTRGSIAERGSPAGNHFRASLVSPRALPGAPPTGMDSWSRPASRDLRSGNSNVNVNVNGTGAGLELVDRRGGMLVPQMQPPAFFQPGYFGGSTLPVSFAPQMYDIYGGGGYRPQVLPGAPGPVPGLAGVPIPGYHHPITGFSAIYPNAGTLGSRHARDQDPTTGARSRLLDEFRATSKTSRRFELKEIYDHVVEFSGDQHGSRLIQQKLETANSDEKDQVFREIEPNALQLMKDVFGNYVIQKFFEHGNQVQKKILASQMKGKVQDLSMQMYACRVVQKALEHVLVAQQAELAKELEPNILTIVKDQNGNHVVQKVIELVPRQYIGFIMDSFRGQVKELASHSYGCRVIQRMLEYGSDDDKAAIMAEIHACTPSLIENQYGNYVIQHVITKGCDAQDRRKTIDAVLSQLMTFSRHKFASNVVEKCIMYGTDEDRARIQEISREKGPDGVTNLCHMMKDQYGNYVIQQLLAQLEETERNSFIESDIRPQFNSLKKITNSRQIGAIEKMLLAVSGQVSPANSRGPSRLSSVTNSDAAHGKGQGGNNNNNSNNMVPASPGLKVDVSSSAPTPPLTMEPNTPQSSSPPSTNASATDEMAEDAGAPLKLKNSAIESTVIGSDVGVNDV